MLTWNVGLLFFKNELIFLKFCFNYNMPTIDSCIPQTISLEFWIC